MTNKYEKQAYWQEIYKINLEHLVIPEHKKVFKTNKQKNTLTGSCQRDRGAN